MITPLTTAVPEEENHRGFFQIFAEFFISYIDFIRYIFYGVFLGEQP